MSNNCCNQFLKLFSDLDVVLQHNGRQPIDLNALFCYCLFCFLVFALFNSLVLF